jgi:hypothetical protein
VLGARTLTGFAALVFFVAHLSALPPSLEDVDSINFAMGVRDFDVAQHQPHPPGYPVFIALGKAATAAARAAGVRHPEVRGLAIWSAVGGALAIVFAFLFFRGIGADERHALWAALLLAASPLFWFTALRPLSDTAGLAVALGALAALAAAAGHRAGARPATGQGADARPATGQGADARPEGRAYWGLCVVGGFAAGLAPGVRSQMAVLAGPMLAYVVLAPNGRLPLRLRIATLGAAILGVLVWAVPLVVVAGGPAAYAAALGSQAGEDFSGVEMLWTHRTPRLAALALLRTFVLPWDSPLLAGVVLALAAGGLALLSMQRPRAVGFLVLAFAPYAAFHLLFQETVTVRYGLPLVAPLVFLASALPARVPGPAGPAVAIGVGLAGLAGSLPAGLAFGRQPAPAFSMIDEMKLFAARGASPYVAAHRSLRRALDWDGGTPGTLLPSPRDLEPLELTRAWRDDPDREGWFAADRRRTDLALIDPEYRRTREYRWPFDARIYLGGARPTHVAWHIYSRPGWFLERGWALTPEVAGITEREGWGPHRQPAVGWLRRRAEPALLTIGGRHLGRPGEPPARLTVTLDGAPLTAIDITPGYFLRFEPIAPGRIAGDGYAMLAVSAQGTDGRPSPRVALEQFNVQNADVLQFAFGEGWYEPELQTRPDGARTWRWMSEAARVHIRPADRAVTVRAVGDYPAAYFHEPLRLWITAGDRTLAELRPPPEFVFEAEVPADALRDAGGVLVLRASGAFAPGELEGTADRRRLAARIYSLDVRPAP